MIELKPVLWRLILEQWQAATAFGIFFAIHKWILDWPAPWIFLLLFARALIQSLLFRHNLHLKISEGELSGPTWSKTSQVHLKIQNELTTTTFLGITSLKDPSGQEISYRSKWYQPTEIQAFQKLLNQSLTRGIASHS